jgi:hypothetical protein
MPSVRRRRQVARRDGGEYGYQRFHCLLSALCVDAEFSNFTPGQLLQAAAAAYDFGTSNISGNPSTIDVGTAHNNYGSSVVSLVNCFH